MEKEEVRKQSNQRALVKGLEEAEEAER